MASRLGELIILTVLSALIGGIAFAFDYYLPAAVFAGVTCTIGTLAVVVRNFW
jgi:hypothetical protein